MSKKKPDLLTGRPEPHESAVVRVQFEDLGQDFLWWDLDADGKVTACGPFQEWLWNGCAVVNLPPTGIRRGDTLKVRSPSVPDQTLALRYRVAKVTRLGVRV
jgi:hypothetical protein